MKPYANVQPYPLKDREAGLGSCLVMANIPSPAKTRCLVAIEADVLHWLGLWNKVLPAWTLTPTHRMRSKGRRQGLGKACNVSTRCAASHHEKPNMQPMTHELALQRELVWRGDGRRIHMFTVCHCDAKRDKMMPVTS